MVKVELRKELLDVPFSIHGVDVLTLKYRYSWFVDGYKLTDDGVIKFKGHIAYEKKVVNKIKASFDENEADMLMGYLYQRYLKKLKKMAWLIDCDPAYVSLLKPHNEDYWWVEIYVNGIEILKIEEEPIIKAEIQGNVSNGEIAIYKIPMNVEKYVEGLKKFEGLETLISVTEGLIRYNKLNAWSLNAPYVLVVDDKAKIKVIDKEYELDKGTYILDINEPINGEENNDCIERC